MTVKIEGELEARLSAAAQGCGMEPSSYAIQVLTRQVPCPLPPSRPDARSIRFQQLRREYGEAASDPMFMKDLREIEEAFVHADSETARLLPDA